MNLRELGLLAHKRAQALRVTRSLKEARRFYRFAVGAYREHIRLFPEVESSMEIHEHLADALLLGLRRYREAVAWYEKFAARAKLSNTNRKRLEKIIEQARLAAEKQENNPPKPATDRKPTFLKRENVYSRIQRQALDLRSCARHKTATTPVELTLRLNINRKGDVKAEITGTLGANKPLTALESCIVEQAAKWTCPQPERKRGFRYQIPLVFE